jgi:hypothetical protein
MIQEEIKKHWMKSGAICYFSDIEKGVDAEGWYSNERNGRWLPLQPSVIRLMDFRNDNTECRPKSLNTDTL